MPTIVHRFIVLFCTLFCAVLLLAPAMPSASAQARVTSLKRQPSPSSPEHLPSFLILGHQRKVDIARHEDLAWTLGEDGYVIAWAYQTDDWTPHAVRQVPQSTALAFKSDELYVYGPEKTSILTRDLTILRTLDVSHEREDRASAETTNIENTRGSLEQHDGDCGSAPEPKDCDSKLSRLGKSSRLGPETSMVSVRTLQDILVADHGSFFIFGDGWYSVSEAPSPKMKAASHVEIYSASDQRVWLPEEILASDVIDGEARVASCATNGEKARVIERNLRTGEVTNVHHSAASCPLRADYEDGDLVLAYSDRVVRWSLGDALVAQADEGTLRSPLSTILGSSLVSKSSLTRSCAIRRWDLSVHTPSGGDSPVARGVCADTATPVNWSYAGGSGGGAGVLLRTRTGSQLWLVDRASLAVFTLQTDVVLAPHVQIQRREDGSFLFADQRIGEALHISSQGRLLSTESMVWIDGRVWREADAGVLVSDDGHQLLATDRGVVLDGIGVGPITRRTITSDRRRLSAQPTLFSAQLRSLVAGGMGLRAR